MASTTTSTSGTATTSTSTRSTYSSCAARSSGAASCDVGTSRMAVVGRGGGEGSAGPTRSRRRLQLP